MLRTQQKRQEEAGHPMESKARNKDVCVRVHVCTFVCVGMCVHALGEGIAGKARLRGKVKRHGSVSFC